MSLTLRINLVLTALLLVLLLAGSLLMRQNLQNRIDHKLEAVSETALSMISSIVTNPDIQDTAKRQLILQVSALTGTRLLYIEYYAADSRFTFRASGSNVSQSHTAPDWFHRLLVPDGQPHYEQLIPGERDSRIQLGPDPSLSIDEVWRDTVPLLYLGLGAIPLCYLLVYLIVRYAMTPARAMRAALGRIEDGDFSIRLPRLGFPELAGLSGAINHVAESLAQAAELEKRLAGEAVRAQERERQHLARELHDELGQSISAIKAMAVSSGAANPQMTQIAALCDHLYDVVNGMLRRLRPVTLEELGLVLALQQTVDDWNEKQDTTFCALSIRGDLSALADEAAIHVYRIVQEGLTNISRHAAASEASITLQRAPDAAGFTLDICDNGRGMALEAGTQRFGLRGIRERIDVLGGELEMTSPPGGGFAIHCRIPLALPSHKEKHHDE
ncbi:histidine kinase [Granulosicoccaceae sp. 1_MG-2023]|nr:histidine kinase [Granulosicoccaceae sp. 1_MG-2023]